MQTASLGTLADLAGRLAITVQYDGTTIRDLHICSSRPHQLTRLLEGRSREEVTAIVPLLFSLCSTAQSVASLTALESNNKVKPCLDVSIARTVLIYLESARELCLRLVKDWLPGSDLINTTRLMQFYQSASSQLNWALQLQSNDLMPSKGQTKPEFCYDALIHNLEVLLSPVTESCHNGRLVAKTSNAISRLVLDTEAEFSTINLYDPSLPLEVTPSYLAHKLRDKDSLLFCSRPEVENGAISRCAESSVWTRNRDSVLVQQSREQGYHPLNQRFFALINELSLLPKKIGVAVSSGVSVVEPLEVVGLAKVPAARGDLIHYIEQTPGAEGIDKYRIVAPTEWNFHPKGTLVSMLTGVNVSRETLRPLVEKLILAIDPCVAYDIQIEE